METKLRELSWKNVISQKKVNDNLYKQKFKYEYLKKEKEKFSIKCRARERCVKPHQIFIKKKKIFSSLLKYYIIF